MAEEIEIEFPNGRKLVLHSGPDNLPDVRVLRDRGSGNETTGTTVNGICPRHGRAEYVRPSDAPPGTFYCPTCLQEQGVSTEEA